MADTLATNDDLAAYLQQPVDQLDTKSADYYLKLASAIVRGYLHNNVTPETRTEILTPDPDGLFATIPDAWPLQDVAKVEIVDYSDPTRPWLDVTDSTEWDPNTATVYALSRNGVRWPLRHRRSWRVTYTAGWDEVPEAIVAVVAQLAGDNYATNAGLKTEHLGEWSATYGDNADLSRAQKAALGPYRNVEVR